MLPAATHFHPGSEVMLRVLRIASAVLFIGSIFAAAAAACAAFPGDAAPDGAWHLALPFENGVVLVDEPSGVFRCGGVIPAWLEWGRTEPERFHLVFTEHPTEPERFRLASVGIREYAVLDHAPPHDARLPQVLVLNGGVVERSIPAADALDRFSRSAHSIAALQGGSTPGEPRPDVRTLPQEEP